MEGSPIRGQEKTPIVQLNESQDLQAFQDDLVRLIRKDLKYAQILFGFRAIDTGSWSLPSWVRSFLERHVALQKKLEQGETVAIGYGRDNPALVPADAARSSIILIPLLAHGTLSGALGLVSPLSGPQTSSEDIERVRRLACEAGPILMRLQEVEKLRRENQRLAAAAEDGARMEERLGRLLQEKTALDAVNQIWSHLQVNVAHELRTPLAAIRGYVRMILAGRGGEVNDTHRGYLGSVCDNTNRLINTVSWMSYVAELSARHFKLSTFDLREVWAE
jgi:signal transduction histidine kinase